QRLGCNAGETKEFEVKGDLLEEHVRANLGAAAACARGTQQRRDFLFHHHLADEGRGTQPVDVERQRVVGIHAQRGGVDRQVDAGRIVRSGPQVELRIV